MEVEMDTVRSVVFLGWLIGALPIWGGRNTYTELTMCPAVRIASEQLFAISV
jgi:hypothetical protein